MKLGSMRKSINKEKPIMRRRLFKLMLPFYMVCAALILLLPNMILSTYAAPLPVMSYYAFQPNGTPFHFYSFGDEIFYDIKYDGIDKCEGFLIERMPKGTTHDGWQRDTMPINGTYQVVNSRYKLEALEELLQYE